MKTDKNKLGLLSQMFDNCQQYKLFSNGDLEWDEEKTLVNSKNCVKIAEDFAIGFAEWLRDDRLNTEFWYEEMTVNELLEIYKKEKGL